MAGRISRSRRDATGKWRAACGKFAELLGFEAGDIWDRWEWIAGCLEYELGIDRVAAEEGAWDRMIVMFDKRGQQSPN